MAKKYYWPTFCHDVKTYVQRCDMCLASKTICHKPSRDLQSLPVLIQYWKDFLMDFAIRLSLSTNWKSDSYNLILVIIGRLIKVVYYEPLKVTIDIVELMEVIINMMI